MRVRTLWMVAALLLLAGCSRDLTGTEGVEVSGEWLVAGRYDAEWFFTLQEDAGGAIRGTWSWPGRVHGNGVRGKRQGREVTLVADSHNAYPVILELTQVRRDRMVGRMELDNRLLDVTVARE